MNEGAARKRDDGNSAAGFVEGVDYYFENGLMVLTAEFLRKRGFCCGNRCRHCPYDRDGRDQSK
jgi:hypothetical protein